MWTRIKPILDTGGLTEIHSGYYTTIYLLDETTLVKRAEYPATVWYSMDIPKELEWPREPDLDMLTTYKRESESLRAKLVDANDYVDTIYAIIDFHDENPSNVSCDAAINQTNALAIEYLKLGLLERDEIMERLVQSDRKRLTIMEQITLTNPTGE